MWYSIAKIFKLSQCLLRKSEIKKIITMIFIFYVKKMFHRYGKKYKLKKENKKINMNRTYNVVKIFNENDRNGFSRLDN